MRKAVTSIPIEAHLIHESHYMVSVRTCPSCSQRYVQVTTEIVDWKDGEDPICRTIIPIDDAERVRLVGSKPLDIRVIEAVGAGRRSLKYDWPKDDLWLIQEYLRSKRREIDQKYDYRYSQLILVFGRLLREGRILEAQLTGLGPAKLTLIQRIASSL